ncbi:MAG TPA: HD domain-containing protein, partial [Limnochordales bacterium]
MHEKIFRDPVHDFITVRDPLLVRLIDTPELQRLRRLRQLGTAAGTYHGAEHSRFGHSLGAMHVMGKVLARLRQSSSVVIDDELERLARAAALLHDIGHGPLSHGLERILTPSKDHEHWTFAILSGATQVRAVLEEHAPGFAEAVLRVLRGDLPPERRWLHHLVASQLDVDRMDYLLRDALYTGAEYGRFDLERLINTLMLVDGQVVFSYKGIPNAEEYVLARHYMYWQVYFHKTTRAQDLVLRAAWQRARELFAAGELEGGRD